VIPTFALVGPLALLAALFPAVFGGLMLVLRRWMILLSVASLDSTVFFFHSWFQASIQGFWWGTPLGLWCILTAITLAGAVCSWLRYRTSSPEARAAALQPQRSEQVILGGASVVGLAVVLVCLWKGWLWQPPWKELLVLWGVAWIGTLYLMFLHLRTSRGPAWPAESVMLWALVFACAGFGATLLPRSQPNGVEVAWVFRPPLQLKERASIYSSPLVAGDRVYVAAALSRGFTTMGRVYCVERATSRLLWTFDDDEEMKQVSISSPCLAEGLLYIGEGFHQDSDCKLYCLDADTGKKRWEYQTHSHVESSPCVAGGKVFFGAGDDGVICCDARTGQERWHFGGIHVDTSPAVVQQRLYAGSGYGQRYEVFCLDTESGRPLWRRPVDLPVWGSPQVVGDRVLVGLGTGDFLHDGDRPQGALLCLDAGTGEVCGEYRVPGAVLMKPVVDAETQRVYFASRDHHVYCLDLRAGNMIWQRDLGSPLVTAAALTGSRLYVAASGGQMACLRADTGDILWSFDVAGHVQASAQLFSSPAVREGRIYFGAGLTNAVGTTAALYCLQEQ
jgi:outer membrane protein assembly factor BamB